MVLPNKGGHLSGMANKPFGHCNVTVAAEISLGRARFGLIRGGRIAKSPFNVEKASYKYKKFT
jgi:hypothetical protein